MNQIERIQYYEGLLNESTAALQQYEHALEAYLRVQDKIAELDNYYTSDAWKADFEASEAGILPKDLPCGVLSEDGIDHLLEDNTELLSQAENVGTITPAKLSMSFVVRKMTEADIPEMLALCEGNPLYYQYCPPAPSAQSLKEDLTVLPPGKSLKDKFFVGFYKEEHLIALMDLILGFPDQSRAFIGFFMTDRSIAGKGIGSQIVGELCRYLANIGFGAVRLGWVQGNPQAEYFWKKNGFVETGVTSQTEDYTIMLAERSLLQKRKDNLTLETIPQNLSVCKLADASAINLSNEFFFIGKTEEELSLVCRTEDTPSNVIACDDGWKGFRIQGTLDFSLIGILSELSGILARHKIGIFAVSTYNTDYILVKEENFERALEALGSEGYMVCNA